MASARQKRYSQIKLVATLIVVGLYLRAMTRLAISENVNDNIVTGFYALALFGTASVILLDAAAPTAPRKRLTMRGKIAVFIALGLVLAGNSIVWSITSPDTVWGQVYTQTVTLGSLLSVGWGPKRRWR
ncbi:hypothetical protein [Nocardia sp. NPDC059229]|uniref:hypothetical protein n=1 Tax=Nocardia sp. NPDC059229 TaxID=3346778 RepID=UPI0036BC1E66